MKNSVAKFSVATLLAVLAGSAQMALADDAIPYPNAGTPNPVEYTFFASQSGPIIAFFAGSAAGDDNQIGLLINGVATGIFGLDDHTSTVGQSLVLGNANAGDKLVFVLENNTVGMNAFSDASLNISYDSDSSQGHNHVYSTAYTATSPVIGDPGVIPAGTYVGFEDEQFPVSDFNYNDESIVVENVQTNSPASTPDATSTIGLLSAGLVGIAGLRRRFAR